MRAVLRAVAVGLLALILMAAPIVAQQTAGITVFVNGQQLPFDVPPAVINGRTLVPLRAIFEALGATVTWDHVTRTAHATWPGGELSLPIGAAKARVKGQEKTLDVPGQIVEGRTLVPLRFVAEAMGARVGWYGGSRVITINVPPQPLLEASVVRVVDGDTVELQLVGGQKETVRLIGVDTPEVHGTVEPYGPEASAYTKEQLPAGTVVYLERDVEERDRYGRLLGYVYLSSGTMFNAMLADGGYAQQLTISPNVRYAEVFRILVADAREQQRGLWETAMPERPPARTEPPTLTTICSDFDTDPSNDCNKPASSSGTVTAPAPPPQLRYDPNGPDRDCGDFDTQAEAQAFYEAAGGPGRDRHRLDADRDGVACEALP